MSPTGLIPRKSLAACAGLLALLATPALASNSSAPALLASAPNPYAAAVVASSNDGLEDQLRELGFTDFDELVRMEGGFVSGPEANNLGPQVQIEIPDVSTTGLLCQLLTLQPAQGCLETQLSRCTQQSWCTSLTRDKCTSGDWCTIAAICTNTQGCTDAGQCTKANGCTGTTYCTSSAGCTQHSSCTNGANCTDDDDLCTGGTHCTEGTGCTNGTNCTAGTGCTADAQCTDGPQCTNGTNCTKGTNCTGGVNCPSSNFASSGSASGDVASAFLGTPLDELLAAPGPLDPREEPHFLPQSSLASVGWLALVLVPALGLGLRKRGSAR